MTSLKRAPSAAMAVLFLGILGLAGCANPIHFKDDIGVNGVGSAVKTQILSMDAKQRAIIYSTRKDPITKEEFTVTCAEPSPDALSAISANLGGSLQNGAGAAASLTSAVAESAASIGLRTQSIQLLRDGMYRSCEAFAAGAISKEEFNRQQRRYQNLMLSLLAIEQISGAVVAQQVGLGGGVSSATSAEGANEAAAAKTKADSAVDAADKELTAAKKKRDDDKGKCDAASDKSKEPACDSTNVSTNEQAVTDKKDALATAQKNQETAKQGLDAVRAAVRSAATGAMVTIDSQTRTRNNMTDASAKYVAEAARAIVATTLLASFAQEDCSRVWNMIESSMSLLLAPEVVSAIEPSIDQQKKLSTIQGKSIFKLMTERAPSATEESDAAKKAFLDQFNELMKACRRGQDALLGGTTLLEPKYADPDRKPAELSVIGGDDEIVFAPKDPTKEFVILGGVAPYYVSVTAPFATKDELTAKTDTKDSKTVLLIGRPDQAKIEGNAKIHLIDAKNAHVTVKVSLKAAEKPAEGPSKKAPKSDGASGGNQASPAKGTK